MRQFNNILILVLFFTTTVFGAGTYLKPPALIEGFTTVASAAGTTTLTRASETKLIITGVTTQTVVMPDATTMTTELGRRFFIINKSSGTVTINASGGGLLGTVAGGSQVEIHLRAAGSAAGTWDFLSYSSGGGTWGSITGTLSAQTDLQSALDLKANLASPTFSGTITTPLTASRVLVTGASSELAASSTTTTTLGYLDVSSSLTTLLAAKQPMATLTTAGDLYVATASATVARQGVTALDGRQLVTDSAATNKIRYQAPMVDNFVKNGDAESVTPIVTYADAAGTRPVDGTGGSPNVTTAISSSSPMFDVNSFTLVKDAANRQGQGWAIPFTIPAGQQAKVLQIEVPYIVSSGTFVAGTSSADSDVIWYIYDVTNSTLIEPSSIKMFSNGTTISDRFIANFQTSATGTSYRLIAHVATTSASAYTLKIDDIQVKPSQYVYGTPITDWVAWTPTGSWSTNTTYTGLKRRVGSDGEYRVKIALAGAPTSASLTVNLPSGEVIDTTKLVDTTAGNDFSFGQANMLDAGIANYIGGISYASTTSVQLNATATGSTYLTNSGAVTQAVQATWGNTDLMTMYFKVPIAGWSSSAQVSDGYDAREISAHLALASNVTPAANGILIYDTKVYDKTNSFSTSTGVYTVPSAGRYRLSIFSVSTSATGNLIVYKNGSIHKYIGTIMGASKGFAGSTTVDCNAGDTLSINSDSNITYTGNVTYNYLTIEKVQTSTTISATEKVYVLRGSTSGQSISANTDTKLQYATNEEDTHGNWSTSNHDYTAQYSGVYEVKGFVSTSEAETVTAGQIFRVRIFVDGVYNKEVSFIRYLGTAAGSGQAASYVGDVKVTAGQKISIVMLSTVACALNTTAGKNWMSMKLIK